MELSSINDVEFFEGTEKLLEVWFSFSEESTSLGGLRRIERFQSFNFIIITNDNYYWYFI